MAGTKLIPTKVKASSILEVVISMVVIVVVFTIAMAIFANVGRLALTGRKLKAQGLLNEVLLTVKQNPVIGTATSTSDGLKIEQEITRYNNTDNLYQVNLMAYDENGDKVAELKEVFYEN